MNSETRSGDAGSKVVLLIEDNCDQAETLMVLLGMEGYKAECSRDGRAGVDRAGELLPDLILMDLKLPDMSGLEVARALRSSKKTAAIPLVLGTGRPEFAISEPLADFDAVLGKPFELPALFALIAKLTSPDRAMDLRSSDIA